MLEERTAFPPNGRRVIFYLLWDARGDVDDYVLYKLEHLRPFAEHLFVVVNGKLTDEGRERLSTVADTVWQRPNIGFDVWGYKSALEEFGDERLSEYDELILMNYTWFGPVNPFEPVFEDMNAREVDFWGMTEFAGQEPNPFTNKGVMHAHIQSHWIAVRHRMFTSDAWKTYWAEMPPITSYFDSILSHESIFTKHFNDLGFTSAVAFPEKNYSTNHAAFLDAETLLADGCPVLKRRPFFHDPLFLDREAVVARRFIEKAEECGYPVELIYQNMAKSAQPKMLNVNAAMMEIMPDVDLGYDDDKPLRTAVILHVFYEDLVNDLLDHCERIPGTFDLYVTTTDEEKAEAVRAALAGRASDKVMRVDIRILPSNRGRDMGAFFVGCRDVLTSGEYELIFKLHTKKTVHVNRNAGELFRRHQLMNLLNSDEYARNVVSLFQREPGLGMVFPPTLHIGYPLLGRAWFINGGPAAKLAKKLGIRVPFDDPSPLAPYGCMFAFRPEALRILSDVEWEYDQYPAPDKHHDGSLAHVQERIFTYAVNELGYHTKTVATTRYAAISHTSLEYKLDRLSKNIPGYINEQVELMDTAGQFVGGGPMGYLKAWLRVSYPDSVKPLYAVYNPVRKSYRLVRRLRWAIANRGRKPKQEQEQTLEILEIDAERDTL